MVPTKHILQQGPVLKAIGQTAIRGLQQRFQKSGGPPPATPGPEIHAIIPPRPRELIADYVRHVGGDPDAYRDSVPPHMFPQWGFPFAARTLATLPYPLMRVFNAGCRLDVKALLPQDQPLLVRARLDSLKVDERRVLLSQRIITGTEREPDAVTAHLYAFIPLGAPSKKAAPKATVPLDAHELANWSLGEDAGLEFALLTGDFNPVHWVAPYARMMGFRNRILHGFSTMARTIEAVNKGLFGGRTWCLDSIDVRFTKPLVLPSRVFAYSKGNHVYVSDGPGTPTYLEGTFAPIDGATPGVTQ
jgi:acyl dehydratase